MNDNTIYEAIDAYMAGKRKKELDCCYDQAKTINPESPTKFFSQLATLNGYRDSDIISYLDMRSVKYDQEDVSRGKEMAFNGILPQKGESLSMTDVREAIVENRNEVRELYIDSLSERVTQDLINGKDIEDITLSAAREGISILDIRQAISQAGREDQENLTAHQYIDVSLENISKISDAEMKLHASKEGDSTRYLCMKSIIRGAMSKIGQGNYRGKMNFLDSIGVNPAYPPTKTTLMSHLNGMSIKDVRNLRQEVDKGVDLQKIRSTYEGYRKSNELNRSKGQKI